MVAGLQDQAVLAVLFVFDAELAEHLVHILAQCDSLLGSGNLTHDRGSARSVKGIQLEQAIAASLQQLTRNRCPFARLLEQQV